jgi:hypothetical protein
MNKWWRDQKGSTKAGLVFLGVCAVLAVFAKTMQCVKCDPAFWRQPNPVSALLFILSGLCWYRAGAWDPKRLSMSIGQIYQGYRDGTIPLPSWQRRVTELAGYVLSWAWRSGCCSGSSRDLSAAASVIGTNDCGKYGPTSLS